MSEQRKAILGGVLAALSVLAGALTGDVTSLGDLGDGQWLAAVVAGLGSYAAVWRVPNDPAH